MVSYHYYAASISLLYSFDLYVYNAFFYMKEAEAIYIYNYSIFSRAQQEKCIQCILYSYLD